MFKHTTYFFLTCTCKHGRSLTNVYSLATTEYLLRFICKHNGLLANVYVNTQKTPNLRVCVSTMLRHLRLRVNTKNRIPHITCTCKDEKCTSIRVRKIHSQQIPYLRVRVNTTDPSHMFTLICKLFISSDLIQILWAKVLNIKLTPYFYI